MDEREQSSTGRTWVAITTFLWTVIAVLIVAGMVAIIADGGYLTSYF